MFDKQKSQKLADDVKSILVKSNTLGLTDGDVTTTVEEDGSVEVTILKGKIVTSGNEGATAKNISAAIDELFTSTRKDGNTFTQPVGGIFTVGIKDKTVNESFSFRKFLAEGIPGGKNAKDATKDSIEAFKKAIKKSELIELIKNKTESEYITHGANESAHDFKVETDSLYLVFVENENGKVNARVDSLVSFLLEDPIEAKDNSWKLRGESSRYYLPIMYNIDLNKLKLIRSELDGNYEGDATLGDARKHIKEDSIKIEY